MVPSSLASQFYLFPVSFYFFQPAPTSYHKSFSFLSVLLCACHSLFVFLSIPLHFTFPHLLFTILHLSLAWVWTCLSVISQENNAVPEFSSSSWLILCTSLFSLTNRTPQGDLKWLMKIIHCSIREHCFWAFYYKTLTWILITTFASSGFFILIFNPWLLQMITHLSKPK